MKRTVLSADNAVSRVRTDRGTVVVKACAEATHFDRLARIADVVAHLEGGDVPVPAPLPANDGAARDHSDR